MVNQTVSIANPQQYATNVLSKFSLSGVAKAVGWLLFGIIIIGACGYFYWVWYQKKIYSKKITVFEIVGSNYTPIYRDIAKVVKLGKGGFEVLFLKKLKTWKLAYGGRVGRDTYYFFIGKDGYWYNGMMSANINEIDKNGGLIPIATTNASMRAQYTALEKQIDSLHGETKGIWEKYGNWILSMSFVLIIGVLAWLIYKEMSPLLSQFSGLVDKMTDLTKSMNNVAINLAQSQPNNLVRVP